MTVLAMIFLVTGLIFLLLATAGVLRFPDFYTRAHAMGKSDTLGVTLSLMGLAVYAVYRGIPLNGLKILLIGLFIALANPTATHFLARAAYRTGLRPWTRRGST